VGSPRRLWKADRRRNRELGQGSQGRWRQGGLTAAVKGRSLLSAHRVTGGGHPPPVPTERGVQIYCTTLFGSWFTALQAPAASGTGRRPRLGTRPLARLCRGRHLRRLSSTRLQGATRTDPGVRPGSSLGSNVGGTNGLKPQALWRTGALLSRCENRRASLVRRFCHETIRPPQSNVRPGNPVPVVRPGTPPAPGKWARGQGKFCGATEGEHASQTTTPSW
jgi:hypothetical protein